VGMLDPLIKTSNKNFSTDVESDLTTSNSQKM
jgi:hypothetical protein